MICEVSNTSIRHMNEAYEVMAMDPAAGEPFSSFDELDEYVAQFLRDYHSVFPAVNPLIIRTAAIDLFGVLGVVPMPPVFQ